MRYLKFSLIIIIAMVLSFLDTAYFSFIELSGVSLIISYVVASTFALIGDNNRLTVLCMALVLFFSVFSSLPPWVVSIVFFVLPSLLYHIRSNYFPLPSVFASILFFAVATSLFEAILLIASKGFERSSIGVIGYFALYNTIAGVIMFYFVRRIQQNFMRGEIKI